MLIMVLLLWLVVAIVGSPHSAAHCVIRLFSGVMAKVIALVVEKSLSCLHNWRLDNVLGQ